MTTAPLTAEQLAAIKAREAAATDGPWLYDHGLLRGGGHIGRRQLAEMHSFSPYHRAEADGTFIAEARTDVPALLAEIDRLRTERESFQLGSLEREALLADAREALEAAGQNGAHGDDWPAVAPAIGALAAELNHTRTALEVAITQHAKAIAARDKAQLRAKTSDSIAAAEREVFQEAIRDLGGDPVQVQNLYAQLTSRTRQWKETKAELEQVRAELATTQAQRDAALDRLASYGTPVLSSPPFPPENPAYAKRRADRALMESGYAPQEGAWAVGRAICPEGRNCPAGEVGVFGLTKRGRIPVHCDAYGRRCLGSGRKATPLKLAPATTRAATFREAARVLEDTGRDDDAVNLLDNIADGVTNPAARPGA